MKEILKSNIKGNLNFDKVWLFSSVRALSKLGKEEMKILTYLLKKRDKGTGIITEDKDTIIKDLKITKEKLENIFDELIEKKLMFRKKDAYQLKINR